MVEQYNVAARASGLTPQQAQAVVGDLCAQDGVPKPLLAPGYFNFDIAAVCLGFHHFESPPLAVRRLAERLKPGSGVLLIIDFLPPELDKNRSRDHSHGHQQPAPTQRGGHQQPASQQPGGHHHHDDHHAHAITTTGFTKDGLRKLYEDAGVGADFEFDVLPETAVLGNDEGSQRRKLFIAKGRRAAKQ
jgi:SAM-dependent methyltransferase